MRLNEWILITDTASNDNGTSDETPVGDLPTVSHAPAASTSGDGFSVGTLRDGVNDAETAGANQNDLSYGNFNIFRTQKTMTGGNLTYKAQISAETEPDNTLTEGQFVTADVIMLVKVGK